MEWYFAVLKNYAGFSGRARRKEYWMFILFSSIILMFTAILDIILALYVPELAFGLFYFVYAFSVMIPSLAVSVRRLHDVGKSGWMILITLIPIVGTIWFFVLTLMDSKPGSNQYGPNPKEVTT